MKRPQKKITFSGHEIMRADELFASGEEIDSAFQYDIDSHGEVLVDEFGNDIAPRQPSKAVLKLEGKFSRAKAKQNSKTTVTEMAMSESSDDIFSSSSERRTNTKSKLKSTTTSIPQVRADDPQQAKKLAKEKKRLERAARESDTANEFFRNPPPGFEAYTMTSVRVQGDAPLGPDGKPEGFACGGRVYPDEDTMNGIPPGDCRGRLKWFAETLREGPLKHVLTKMARGSVQPPCEKSAFLEFCKTFNSNVSLGGADGDGAPKRRSGSSGRSGNDQGSGGGGDVDAGGPKIRVWNVVRAGNHDDDSGQNSVGKEGVVPHVRGETNGDMGGGGVVGEGANGKRHPLGPLMWCVVEGLLRLRPFSKVSEELVKVCVYVYMFIRMYVCSAYVVCG